MTTVIEKAMMPAGFEVLFYPSSHRYKIEDEWVPSATTISDLADDGGKFGAAAWWSYKIGVEAGVHVTENSDAMLTIYESIEKAKGTELNPNKARNKAGDYGKLIHKAFERHLQENVEIDPSKFPLEAQSKVRGLLKFLDEHTLDPIHAEKIVGSQVHQCAGTLDFFGGLDGAATLLDLKSGTHLPLNHSIQLAGYEGMGVESGILPAAGLNKVVIQLVEDDYKIHPCTLTFDDFLIYRQCYDISKKVD